MAEMLIKVVINLNVIANEVYEWANKAGISSLREIDSKYITEDLAELFLLLSKNRDTFGAFDHTTARGVVGTFVPKITTQIRAGQYTEIDECIKLVYKQVVGYMCRVEIFELDEFSIRNGRLYAYAYAERSLDRCRE